MRNEKGSITLYTLLAMLFFLILVMVAASNISLKSKTQVETTEVLLDTYKSDTSSSAIYNTIVTGEDATVNEIKTSDENSVVSSSNTTDYIAIDGKIYNVVVNATE